MEILISKFLLLLFIFVRILSAFLTAPLFSHRSIPAQVKVALSLVISYIIFTFIGDPNVELEISTGFILINVLKEALTGVLLGFTINVVFYGISFAGSIMGFDIGLSMAQVFNPIEETNNNLVGEIFHTLAILLFILINGHHYFIGALIQSFNVVPIGYYSLNSGVYDFIVKLGATTFIIAVKIASPILVSYFLVHIAEGIMARIIPQMQVFFVTYPLKLGLGIFLIITSLPIYVYVIKGLLSNYQTKLNELINLMSA